MDLAEVNQRPGLVLCSGARSCKEKPTVRFYMLSLILFGKAQVKRSTAINGALATGPNAESMHQPGNAREQRSAKKRRLCRRGCCDFSGLTTCRRSFCEPLFARSSDGRHSS